jgi:hypothetical protein
MLAGFNGTNPNGLWLLYVVDDSPGDSGSIAGGWSLNILTSGSLPPAAFLPPAVSAGQLQLSFFTANGLTYIVEYKNDLAAGTWTQLGSVPGNGTVQSISDSTTQHQRFYRIRTQ